MAEPDRNRIEARIAFLKKNRPRDPEIAALKAKLAKLPAVTTPAPAPATPTPTVPSYVEEPLGPQYPTDTLSPRQQKIVGQGEALTEKGQLMAIRNLEGTDLETAFNPETAPRFSAGQNDAERQRIEEQIFGKFTRDLDQREGLETEKAKQQLANKGIPFSADPNSRYQQELGVITRNYGTQRENARQTATQLGGEEYQRNFGINEQLIANQLSQASGIRNQQMNEVQGLSQQGLGLEPYQMFQNLSEAEKERALQQALAKMQAKTQTNIANINNRNRGGGASTTEETSPFSPGPPPGL